VYLGCSDYKIQSIIFLDFRIWNGEKTIFPAKI